MSVNEVQTRYREMLEQPENGARSAAERPDPSDPFAALTAEIERVLRNLRADLEATEARIERRQLQVKTLERVVGILRDASAQALAAPTPLAGPRRRGRGGARLLACGHWPRQAEHKDCIAAREAPALA